MALITIYGETLAALLFAGFVGAYKFGDPWESLCTLRNFIAEIDQQITWADFVRAATDSNWRLGI